MRKRIITIFTAASIAFAVIPALSPYARADTDDPLYYVYIERSGTEYTADVTLDNIAATYGTFGLKYDTSLFEFTGVDLNPALELIFTPASMYGGDDEGYYCFVWQSGKGDSSEFDTTKAPQKLATLTFKLIGSADDVSQNSFTVIPWNDTGPAKEFAKTLPKNNPKFEPRKYFSEYWRYTDEENEPGNLTRGRLEKSKACVIGLDTQGFYQAAVNADLDDESGSYFYDVKTVIEYDFGVKNAILRIHVIDKDTGEDIEDAQTYLYDASGGQYGALATDTLGNADYTTDAHKKEKFSYTVTKAGYSPVPVSGANRPTVETAVGASTEVTVELEKAYTLKGYVDLGQGTDMSGAVQSGADVTFTRADGLELTWQTTASRNDAVFEADALPKGTWTITVTKPGCVKYIITDFDFNPTSAETVFADGKKITPYIGSAKTGTSVSLIDAAMIKAEMRLGAVQTCGDVDDNGRVDATDMAYVMFNYGKRTTQETYASFLAKGAINSPQNP